MDSFVKKTESMLKEYENDPSNEFLKSMKDVEEVGKLMDVSIPKDIYINVPNVQSNKGSGNKNKIQKLRALSIRGLREGYVGRTQYPGRTACYAGHTHAKCRHLVQSRGEEVVAQIVPRVTHWVRYEVAKAKKYFVKNSLFTIPRAVPV
uniref:Uncharacterized protein n=1 Tax=Lactuca sativa TaxID=4236 RepID=A0A9R1UEE9_LACSA|nr:hypothetical protein LSAT_V11C900483050 [Lactuca sativa]